MRSARSSSPGWRPTSLPKWSRLIGDDRRRRTSRTHEGWNARLADDGWAACPAGEFGGRDADVDQQLAYHEEMSRTGAPGPINTIGVSNIAPPSWRSERRAEERFLRPMLRATRFGPKACPSPTPFRFGLAPHGSSHRRRHLCGERAKDVEQHGRLCRLCQVYVRTDPEAPKHKGISCLLIDMSTPGSPCGRCAPCRVTTCFPSSSLMMWWYLAPPTRILNEGWRWR